MGVTWMELVATTKLLGKMHLLHVNGHSSTGPRKVDSSFSLFSGPQGVESITLAISTTVEERNTAIGIYFFTLIFLVKEYLHFLVDTDSW